MSEDQNYEGHIQELRESVFMPPDMTLKFCNISKGDWVSVKERIFWAYLDEELIDKHFRLYPDNEKAEYVRQLRSKHRLPKKPIKKEESEKLWLFGRIFDSDLLDEDEIRNIREGARLRAEACRARTMAYFKSKSIDVGPSNPSPATASQEHTNPNRYQTSHGDAEADGGGGGQFLNYHQPTDTVGEPLNSSPAIQKGKAAVLSNTEAGGSSSQANGSMNSSPPKKTVKFSAASSDIEAGGSSSLAVNQPARRYELETTFMVVGQLVSTAAALWAKKSTAEMPSEAKGVGYLLSGCICVALTSSLYGLLLSGNRRRNKDVVQVVKVIGFVATATALLAATGLQLPDRLILWGTLVVK